MSEHLHQIMDRQIFNLNLSVEATSAYIVVTSIVDENRPPTLEAILGRWTIAPEALNRSIIELLDRGVVQSRPGPEGAIMYFPNPASLWR
ncbi:MAG: hypothetical protein HQK55_12155 [Deltaproteobacteria bacterium]|nr:hypothetical protein [Deltaproteobacteria bacterium]